MRSRRTLPQILAVLAILFGVLGMHSVVQCELGATDMSAHDMSAHAGDAMLDSADDDCQYHQCTAVITAATPSFHAPHLGGWIGPPQVPSTSPASWMLPAQGLSTAPSWTNFSLAQLQILRV